MKNTLNTSYVRYPIYTKNTKNTKNVYKTTQNVPRSFYETKIYCDKNNLNYKFIKKSYIMKYCTFYRHVFIKVMPMIKTSHYNDRISVFVITDST